MRRAWSFDAAKSARFCRAHLQPIKNRSRERHSVHKNRRLGEHEEQNDTSCPQNEAFLWIRTAKWCQLPRKGVFSWIWRRIWWQLPRKGAFSWTTGWENIKDGNMHTIARRFSAASSASARLSKKVEAAVTPDQSTASGRYAPARGWLSDAKTGVEIVAKKKPGGLPGEFFACYKRNKFICWAQ